MVDYTNKVIYLNGDLYKVLRTFEGDVDLSYHGSPWYETFIEAQNLETDEIKIFGSQTYHWCDAKLHIKYLEEKIESIKKLLS